MYTKCKLHWVTSKVYMNPELQNHFGVHSLRMQPNVVYTSINLRKISFGLIFVLRPLDTF